MSALKILVATDQWFPDYAGGSARIAAETARELAGRGHDVTVLAPRASGSSGTECADGVTVHRVLPRNLLPQSVSDVLSVARLARKLRPEPDVIVAHQVTVAAGVALSAAASPVVLVYHGSAPREAQLRQAGRIRSAFLTRTERGASRRADLVLTLSEYSRALVLGDGVASAEKVATVPGGIDTSVFRPPADRAATRRRLGFHERPVVAVVRRLERSLGLEPVLEAFPLVSRETGAELVIIGVGPHETELRRLSVGLGIEDRVHFVGRRSPTELPDWYGAADVCIAAPAVHEGFGLAVIEALACGTPVVGVETGAIPELLGPFEPRLLSAENGAGTLARTTLNALALVDDAFRARCVAYAHERFSWTSAIVPWEEAIAGAALRQTTCEDAAGPGERVRVDVLGAQVDRVSFDAALAEITRAVESRQPMVHGALNAAKIVRLRDDPELAEALRTCDVLTADGQAVVWAARLLGRKLPGRVTGIDLMLAVLARAEERGWRVFFLGAERDALSAAVAAVRERHPFLTIAGSRDGYFLPEEEKDIVAEVAEARTDILFVGLGTPQKELFLSRYRETLGASFMMGVGGAIDVLAGKTRRAPAWMQRSGFEWAFRLVQEPRRLFWRYILGNARFLGLVCRELVGGRR